MSNPPLFSQQLLENLTTATVALDGELRVQYINPAAEALLDCSGKRAAGQMFSKLFMPNFEQLQSLEAQFSEARPFTRRAVELPLSSGRSVTVDLAITPLEADSEAQVLLEFQSLDRFLRISREETLLSSQTTSRSLIRGLAHEIKNPLGGLRGAAQLLAKELKTPALMDYTQVIIEEADRLRDLVDRMLGPNTANVLEPTNIHEVLERVCTLVQAENPQELIIVRDYDPSIPELQGDAGQLIQAILNIMRNAAQALSTLGPDHPAVITLRTRIIRQFTIGQRRHRLVVRLDVEDNGPGIDTELMHAVFYPMISGRPDGSGLGLSIAQSIVHRHQGLIECDSQPGSTVFSLFIPLEPVSDDT